MSFHVGPGAYRDEHRLADRAAIYKHRQPSHTDTGPYPQRGSELAAMLSTFLDRAINGPALEIGTGTGTYLPLIVDSSIVVARLMRSRTAIRTSAVQMHDQARAPPDLSATLRTYTTSDLPKY